jgi:hypothetical protein
MNPDARNERDALEQKLITQLEEAAERYRTAKVNYQSALKLRTDLGLGHCDGDHSVRMALREENAARSLYIEKLKAFTDFTIHGKRS